MLKVFLLLEKWSLCVAQRHQQLNSVWIFACSKQTVCSGNPWCCCVFSCGAIVHTHQPKLWNLARYLTVFFNNQVFSQHSQQLQNVKAARCSIFFVCRHCFLKMITQCCKVYFTPNGNMLWIMFCGPDIVDLFKWKVPPLLGWRLGVKLHEKVKETLEVVQESRRKITVRNSTTFVLHWCADSTQTQVRKLICFMLSFQKLKRPSSLISQ